MWLTLLLIIAAIVALAYLYGFFIPINTYRDKLSSPHLIYYTFAGKSDQLSAQFQKIKKDLSQHFRLPAIIFRAYSTDPLQTVWECHIGFQVNVGETNKAESFLNKHSEYRQAKLKSTRYVGCTISYLNELSFIFNIYKIKHFFDALEQSKVQKRKGLIQRYNFTPHLFKTVELVNPIDNYEQWEHL